MLWAVPFGARPFFAWKSHGPKGAKERQWGNFCEKGCFSGVWGLPKGGFSPLLKKLKNFFKKVLHFPFECDIITQYSKRPVSQAAKTSPSHGEGMGSIPVRVTKKEKAPQARCLFLFGDLCRKRHSVCAAHTWVRQTPIERVELARKRQRRLFLPKGQMSVRVKYRKRGAFSFLVACAASDTVCAQHTHGCGKRRSSASSLLVSGKCLCERFSPSKQKN